MLARVLLVLLGWTKQSSDCRNQDFKQESEHDGTQCKEVKSGLYKTFWMCSSAARQLHAGPLVGGSDMHSSDK